MSTLFACRSCGSADVAAVLSLGRLPLVNALVEPDDTEEEPTFPLDVVRCTQCTLVQLAQSVPPSSLFRTYTYFSSYSETFLEHARAFADQVVDDLGLDERSLVVEAASNDGYLLRWFRERGVRTLGIEPAENVAAVARRDGIETIPEFLDEGLATSIVAEHGTADLVVANNVLAHVPDPNGFVSALACIAGDDGVISVEVPYLRDLVDGLEFDTIYHEHLSYFSVTSLEPLFGRQGLTVVDVERLPVHGGSLRLTLARRATPSPTVARLRAEEEAWGIRDEQRFTAFANGVDALRAGVHDLVARAAGSHGAVGGYGAAAKAVVLANTCGLDPSLVAFVVDRSPHKQGKLMPGVRIPIEPPEVLAERNPSHCVIFAWNLVDEIVEQQTEYTRKGGRFIVPIPKPRIVET